MKIFFDTEFTELSLNAKLLSIGCISENGDHFYAEIPGVVTNTLSKWVRENVISNMYFINKSPDKIKSNKEKLEKIDALEFVYGTKSVVSAKFNKWLKSFGEDIEFVSDVCAYDFVLLVDLITEGKTSLDLPDYITPDCLNINQIMADVEDISLKEAFDINREEYANPSLGLDFILKDMSTTDNKHNSLWDAHVIKTIYEDNNLGV